VPRHTFRRKVSFGHLHACQSLGGFQQAKKDPAARFDWGWARNGMRRSESISKPSQNPDSVVLLVTFVAGFVVHVGGFVNARLSKQVDALQ
jgi:hypothetical protein